MLASLVMKRAIESPYLEEIACSTEANITKHKCDLCVCPYVWYTHSASFFKGRLNIYIYVMY